MKISAFCALFNEHPALKDAEFGVADGCLCIIGLKDDERRYWHVPVLPLGSNVSRESLQNRLADGLKVADDTAKKWAGAGESVAPSTPESLDEIETEEPAEA